eukprot:COSAG01_NODE_2658_length_7302_cov_4.298626_7_plen_91_part_00
MRAEGRPERLLTEPARLQVTPRHRGGGGGGGLTPHNAAAGGWLPAPAAPLFATPPPPPPPSLWPQWRGGRVVERQHAQRWGRVAHELLQR